METHALDGPPRRKAQWLDLGIFCGLAASVAYTLAVFPQLPRLASYLTFSAFAPLLCAACTGLDVFPRSRV